MNFKLYRQNLMKLKSVMGDLKIDEICTSQESSIFLQKLIRSKIELRLYFYFLYILLKLFFSPLPTLDINL